MKRLLITIGVAMLALLAVLLVWLRFGVDQSHIQHLLAKSVGPEYVVQVEYARVWPLRRRLAIGNISVTQAQTGRIVFQADTVRVARVNPGVVFGISIRLGEFMMDSFTLSTSSAGDGEPIPQLAVTSLSLTNGTIIQQEDGRETSRLTQFNMHGAFAREIITREDTIRFEQYRMAIDSLGFRFSEDQYQLTLSALHINSADSILTLSALSLTPVGGFDAFMQAQEFATTMYDVDVSNLTLAGLDTEAYQTQRALNIRLVDADTLRLYIAMDKQRPGNPARLHAVTYVQNHAELNTELAFTLHDGPFRMQGSGNLQSFDLKQLNSILMDLEGIEIVDGFVRELDFQFEIEDDTSTGRMHMIYENLDVAVGHVRYRITPVT
jgi:hypothetical protein